MEWERSMADTGNGQGADTVREGDVAAPVAPIAAAAFDRAYVSTPPWDMLSPQPAFVGLVEAGRIARSVLDIGCGTGELALYLSERRLAVLGIDRSLRAINKAQAKAAERELAVWFAVVDAVALGDLGEICDTVVDSGLQTAVRPGGHSHVLCFNEHAAAAIGPRAVPQAELRTLFSSACPSYSTCFLSTGNPLRLVSDTLYPFGTASTASPTRDSFATS